MIRIHKILFPTDFSRCSEQAMDHALYMAKRFRAELHILHVIALHRNDPHNRTCPSPVNEQLLSHTQSFSAARLSAIAKPFRHSDVPITTVQRRGISAAETIMGYARENDVDLIVLGTHGRRGLGRLFLGSVAEEVVRFAHCPIFSVRELEEPVALETMKQVLVPVDFSRNSRRALSHAKELAALYEAKLLILHVIDETAYPAYYAAGKTSVFDYRPEIRTRSKEAMRRFFQEVEGPRVAAEFFCADGRPSREILRFSKDHHADLEVIATHGSSGVEHLLIGSVAEKVVRQAPCPVFTVKTFGRKVIDL